MKLSGKAYLDKIIKIKCRLDHDEIEHDVVRKSVPNFWHHALNIRGCIAFIFLSTVYLLQINYAAAVENHRKVLIIYSYNDLMPWQTSIRTGLQERLAEFKPDERPDIYEEQIDFARIDFASSSPAFVNYVQAKYAAVKFDAVIAESAAATRLLRTHPGLFADTERYAIDPVGFESLSPDENGIHVISPQGDWAAKALLAVTGVVPSVTRIIAIVDHSPIGDANKTSLLAAARTLPPAVKLEVWDDFSFSELFERAAHLPPDAALLYSVVFKDRTGAPQIPRSVARSLAAAASVPVFGHWDTLLGTGIVGGRMLSSRREGAMIADLALGPGYAEIGADSEAMLNPLMFDDAALRRWSIDETRLPAGSVVSGRDESIWHHYRWQIGIVIAALLLEGLLILWLITALKQGKVASDSMIRERDGLELRVSERTGELLAAKRRLEDSNARLEELASTDALTGIANRRKFLEVAEAGLRRAHRDDRPLSFLMLDIDMFKAINDRHGHGVGDQVIRAMAEICRTQVRAEDCVGRMGGEEFAILLPEIDATEAIVCAERIRDFTSTCPIDTPGGETLSLTVSIGVSTLLGDADTLDAMTARADKALYQAKNNGRNRVVGDLSADQPVALRF